MERSDEGSRNVMTIFQLVLLIALMTLVLYGVGLVFDRAFRPRPHTIDRGER